jgi:MFS family permease
MQDRLPAAAIWGLGATQIIGYGTLYYSYSVLAPEIGREFGWPPEWTFFALTLALLAGGLLAHAAGQLVDRYGAVRTMTLGSIAAAAMLVAAGLAPNGYAFTAALVGMEIASTAVLYATAFAAIVELGGRNAQRSITHLTLIAGFASTLFWPLTALLLTWMDWRAVYLVFAAMNLLICAPLHLSLGRVGALRPAVPDGHDDPQVTATGTISGSRRKLVLALMMAGFALEGLVLSAVLMQIIPVLLALELGAGAFLVTTAFGPAQVLGRLVNMLFGRNLSSTRLAIIAAAFLPLGACALAVTAPSLPGAVLFGLLFGLGSGLTSIVTGTLPLQLLGRERYGSRLGWLSSSRQVASAIAPFLMALTIGGLGTLGALWIVVAAGLLAVVVFAIIAVLPTSDRKETSLLSEWA